MKTGPRRRQCQVKPLLYSRSRPTSSNRFTCPTETGTSFDFVSHSSRSLNPPGSGPIKQASYISLGGVGNSPLEKKHRHSNSTSSNSTRRLQHTDSTVPRPATSPRLLPRSLLSHPRPTKEISVQLTVIPGPLDSQKTPPQPRQAPNQSLDSCQGKRGLHFGGCASSSQQGDVR